MGLRKAIIRKPDESIVNGITTAQLGKPDFTKASEQHSEYADALRKCGLDVICIEPDTQYPDSVFIEDTAVVTKNFAIITHPQPESRKGETAATEETLKKIFSSLEFIKPPGTLEGGDVMKAGSHFFVGLTNRTNKEGAKQFNDIVKKFGYTSSAVVINGLLHLKTGMSFLENNTLLITRKLSKHPAFKDYSKITVDSEEEYAANSLWINDTVIVPQDFPQTHGKIQRAGYHTIQLNMSEFRKLDGGLSCLSLRF